jgi:hypothetical protein
VTVVVGGKSEKGDRCYVMREGDPHVFAVDEHAHHLAEMDYLYFRSRNLLGFDNEDIVSLTVKTPEEKVVCVRDQDSWTITEPKGLKADDVALRGISGKAGMLQVRNYVEENPTDLEKYGLDNPRSITVVLSGGESKGTHEILLGSTTPDGRYAMFRGGSLVFLLSSDTAATLGADVVSLKLLGFDADEVKRVLREAGPDMLVIARDGGKWGFPGKTGLRVEEKKVNEIVDTLSSLEAESVLRYSGGDLKALGLAPPALKLTVELGGDSLTVNLGRLPDGRTSAMLPGDRSVFLLAEKTMEKIDRSAPELVAYRFTSFATGEVTGISLERGGEKIAVEKKDRRWQMITPAGQNASHIKFFRLLADLSKLRGQKVVEFQAQDLKKYGLDPPAFSVTAVTKEGSQTVCVGKKTKEGVYACRKGESCVFLVKPESIARIDKRLPDLTTPPPGKGGMMKKEPVKRVPPKKAPAKKRSRRERNR